MNQLITILAGMIDKYKEFDASSVQLKDSHKLDLIVGHKGTVYKLTCSHVGNGNFAEILSDLRTQEGEV